MATGEERPGVGAVHRAALRLAVAATLAYASIATFVIIKLVDVVLGIRVPQREEELGLDLSTHGEVAYT